MKHWIHEQECDRVKIKLRGFKKPNSNEYCRTVSVSVLDDGAVVISEECDGYFAERYSAKEAIEALEEAISFIKSKKERALKEKE